MGIHVPAWQPRGWIAPTEVSTRDYHVVVVGGGLSGVAAAVAAARRGARVALLEPTHLLGGQMTVAGVGTVDLAPGFRTTVEQGLWGEIARRIRRIYHGYHLSTAVARYRTEDSLSSNPVVTDRVLTELCHQAGVEVLLSCPVEAATVSETGARLSTVAGVLSGAVAVDATEDGSLLALADLPFRAGNLHGRGARPLDGRSEIQKLVQCAVIRRYDDGIPRRLRMDRPPADYQDSLERIAGSFPGRPGRPFSSAVEFAGYRALPDIAGLHDCRATDVAGIRRTSLNHMMDVPITTEYLTDPGYREAAQTRALNLTLAVIYYLQHECGLPWAVAQDEGYREGRRLRTTGVTPEMPHWVADLPLTPYLRESRRLVGAATLTGTRIRRERANTACRWSTRTLAVGTYGTDLHGSKAPEDFEVSLGESLDDVAFGQRGPFPVPAGCFVPADDRRLVAAEKNLSMTRVASAAVRVQPSVVAVGEAAGVIAALASRNDVAPRRVSYRAVQVALLEGGAGLLPYPIAGVPPSDRHYPAVALAVLHHRVQAQVDEERNQVRLTAEQRRAAVEIGARLTHFWRGPR